MRALLALSFYLAILAPGIAPAAYPAQGPVVIDRDPFPLNRTELQGWEFRPSVLSCGDSGITLPHYWKDAREGTFRREVVIPHGMKGRAVFFQAVADTGGEIFLDGASRGSFERRGRLLLTGRASGGEKYQVALRCGLAKPFGVFTDASLIRPRRGAVAPVPENRPAAAGHNIPLDFPGGRVEVQSRRRSLLRQPGP